MSRILLVGMGVPASVASSRHAGPGLRSAHFASALTAAGHDVLLLAVLGDDEMVPAADTCGGAGGAIEFTTERGLLSAPVRALVARFCPDAVVGVTVYGAALAARLRLDVPMWADVFGDLMAEAQAKAARLSNDWSIVHFWTLLRGVLESADRFSAVSVAQSHALVGQLGLAGRLSSRTANEELVAVIPCAADRASSGGERAVLRRELGLTDDDFAVLVSGGVNTWCDVETLCDGLGAAMEAEPRLHVVVSGGAIPGHDDASNAVLLAALAKLPAARVHVLGWIDSNRLPDLYAAADLALHIERTLYERRLGAENRVVEWMAHSLACLTTAQSETGAALVAAGLAIGCRAGDADHLARLLCEAASGTSAALRHARAHGREWAASERGFGKTAAPLLEWCAAPGFAGDRDGARLVRLGLLSQPQTSVEMLEAYVAQLPAREIVRRGARWFARRAWLATGGLLVRAFARVAPRRDAMAATRTRRFFHLTVLVVAIGSQLSTGCRGPGMSPASRPNVVLLSIDTLRTDHLGAYGYNATPSPSPWMDALAARGMLVEHAVTSAPETAPAVATLHTGVYQDRHGLTFNRAKLAPENHTLAERLHESGYATAAFVGNWLVGPKHGFEQGFDTFEVVTPGSGVGTTTDDKLVALFGDFLRARSGDAPWFAWVHMMDPHGPFNSASPWWSQGFDYSKSPLSRDGEFPVSDSNFGLGVIPLYQKLDATRLLSDYVRRYDGDIRFTDTQVGALLAMLAAAGVADDTIVVLVADHGESLVEHDELLQHGWFVYDTTVRIPLVFAGPGLPSPGERVKAVTCGVDVMPSILELAGVTAAGGDFDGRPVRPDTGQPRTSTVSKPDADAAALRDAGCFSFGPRANHVFSLSTATHKLIVSPAGTQRDPRAPKEQASTAQESLELYDLVGDPGELTNLAPSRPDLVEEMQAPLVTMRSRFRAHGWRW